MDPDLLKLLTRLGALSCAEAPSEEPGAGDGDGADGSTDGDDENDGSADDHQDGQEGTDGFKPITSQDDLDRVLGKRLRQERAKFSDYDQLKQRVEDLEATNASLSERLSEESHKALVSRVSRDTGVDEEDLHGSTEEELRAAAKRFTDRVEAAAAKLKSRGRSPHTGTGDERPPEPTLQSGRERARAMVK